jgi:predicted  nucleic acid-binding Zn-ribbon protein
LATIDDSTLVTDLRRAQNSLQQSILSYNTKVRPLSDLELEQINGSFQINVLNQKNKELTTAQDSVSNEKSLDDMNAKMLILQQDLKDLDSDNSLQEKRDEQNQSVIQKQKDLLIQILDLNQKVVVNLREIDEFLGVSSANVNKNDAFEFLI